MPRYAVRCQDVFFTATCVCSAVLDMNSVSILSDQISYQLTNYF